MSLTLHVTSRNFENYHDYKFLHDLSLPLTQFYALQILHYFTYGISDTLLFTYLNYRLR